MRELLGKQAAAGARLRAAFPPKTLSYGAQAAEKIDVFAPAGVAGGLPAMVFIHGGNWRVGTKESVSCLATPFLEGGAIFAAPEFDSIPANTLPGMAEQCRRAILWVWRHARELGVDPDRIHVGGHSAGGHLAAVMLTTDWTRHGAPPDLLKGGLVLSGLCDLEPVVLAAGNRHLKLTAAERIELSPVHRLRDVKCPVIVAWGTGDSPEFKRQGMLMARQLRAAGRLAGTYVLQGVNHFEILDVLASGQSQLAAAALAAIR
ncbi:alpha/beta hydrolase [Pseudoduganella lutea]|uniref:Alpha/beta hydrolase n=2 Tax=Pseudoduganella lutea TaxID=321985 RepID=A0A4V0Z4N0_9BURK|nr:alpha/beta hydrolase [Pseudoduganella lutea]